MLLLLTEDLSAVGVAWYVQLEVFVDGSRWLDLARIFVSVDGVSDEYDLLGVGACHLRRTALEVGNFVQLFDKLVLAKRLQA